MSDEYKIELTLSAEELIKFGNAVAAICFFPKFVQAEVQRLGFREGVKHHEDGITFDGEMAGRLEALASEAVRAHDIGDRLAQKIGSATPVRIDGGTTQ